MIVSIEFATPEYDEAVSLRYKILRKPLDLEFSEEQLMEEFDQFHFGYYNLQGKLIACLSYQLKEDGVLKMRQVAVDDSQQGRGIGTRMVKETENWAQSSGYNKIILHARDTAVKFYKKLNYSIKGKDFTEVGIKHFLMEKTL